MNALFWIFGLGALAVAFPFLFHLIRRTPKGQTEFSSLMFLRSSPPTLTRRSRLENFLLLFLRAAAICLIALAFMRPFLRGADSLVDMEVAGRRIAVLVDTSASMRRGDLWNQVEAQVQDVLEGLEKGDDFSLYTFDSQVRQVIPFLSDDESISSVATKTSNVSSELKAVSLSWSRSDLGGALIHVADQLDLWKDASRSSDNPADAKLQVVVVSDMQKSSELEALQSYQWPGDIYVKFLPVQLKETNNATVQLLNRIEEDDPSVRIRVSNGDESKSDQFDVRWFSGEAEKSAEAMTFFVPAGTSRVLKISPDQAIGVDRFVLTGDEDDFDNAFHVVPVQKQELAVAYFGDEDPSNPNEPLFYFQRSFVDTAEQTVTVHQFNSTESKSLSDLENLTLVVVANVVTAARQQEIEQFARKGGTVLVLLRNSDMTSQLVSWTGAMIESSDPPASDYQMLAEVSFSHPLLEPFANARFNDFTKIRFWNYQPVEINESDVKVLSWFDNQHPAIWTRPLNEGQVYTFASGWHPDQSQLALSTKFVPLMNRLLELAANLPELKQSLMVGDPIQFPGGAINRVMVGPTGDREAIDSDETEFANTNTPGIYRLEPTSNELGATADETMLFAVNVDRAESETSLLPVEQVEAFDVKVGDQTKASADLNQRREKKDREIENQQKFWKWLIVSAILILLGETWLAGRTQSKLVANTSLDPFTGETA